MHRFESEKGPVEVKPRIPVVSEEVVTLATRIPQQRTGFPELIISESKVDQIIADARTHVERRANLDTSRRRLLNDLTKIKDLDDFRPSELSEQFHVSVQIIYEGLSTLRQKEGRKQYRPPLTADEKEKRWNQLLQLREQGFTDPEIGEIANLAPGTVASEWNKMKRFGIDLPPRKTGRRPKGHEAGPLPIISPEDRIEILKRDLSARQRGEILGIQPESVRHYCRVLRKQGVDIPKRNPGSIAEQRRQGKLS